MCVSISVGKLIFPSTLVCLFALYASLVWRDKMLQKKTKELIDDDSQEIVLATHLHLHLL